MTRDLGRQHRVDRPQSEPRAIMPCGLASAGMIACPMTLTASGSRTCIPRGTRVNERGHLEIGGCDAIELAREFGTPVYVVAEHGPARARAGVRRRGCGPPRDFDVLFASKAFPCTGVYRVLAEEGLACDVASGGELALALAAGFDPARIYLHGNAKSDAELREALEAGVGHVVLDSFDELDRLERIAAERGHAPGGADPGHARTSPATPTRRSPPARPTRSSGCLPIEAARGDRRGCRRRPRHLDLVGLHFHIGSQLFELEPFRAAVRAIAQLGDFPGLQLRRRARRRLHRRPAPARRSRTTSRRSSPSRTSCSARASGCCSSPAARSWPTRRSRSTRSRRSSATSRPGWPSTAACPTTCGRCSTAPATRR